ncbi:FAD dependent oxidoreductase [Diaporthe amygdali]|uniref:FAD dependent oxidoreductase n=1 Tax=Phomopsis amygdali TaxID=1214568 RepID=UPI0022FE4DC4|nr:FAD dependent oxidoreductase [Diaporthe amygdali]KAJ0110030.1 FAD dependent oxidoreductase [Diaporthe amygdali]
MDAGMTRRQLLLIFLLTAFTVFVYHRQYFFAAEQGTTSPSQTMPPNTQSPTVIVVGAGLAGLSASYSALRAGAAVRLLERAEKPGGNSIKASSGINGAPTRFQKGPDTSFHSDTVRSAGARLAKADDSAVNFRRKERESLISRLTGSSAQAVDFLVDEIGVELSVVAQLGGHSFPRTHRGGGKLPPGAAIVTGLLEKLKQDPNFELQTGCEVSKILTATEDKGAVKGVQYTKEGSPHTLEGAVVFTTGGFAGDTWGLLKQYRPDLSGLPSTNDNRPGTHNILTDLGAHLVDMESVQIHPTGFILPSDPQARVKFLAAEMLRGEGGILLHKGKRFVNEMDTREHVSNVIMSLPSAKPDQESVEALTQWDVELLLDPGACDAASSHIGFYLWKGLLTKKKVKDLDETTKQTIHEYAQVAAGKAKDEFGRTTFGSWRLAGTAADDEQEVCVGRVTPITHFTMGGAAINEKSQILVSGAAGQDLRPVEGLWAAGEITGGIHGDNRLGGSSLLECVVFGRVAGHEAAAYARSAAV